MCIIDTAIPLSIFKKGQPRTGQAMWGHPLEGFPCGLKFACLYGVRRQANFNPTFYIVDSAVDYISQQSLNRKAFNHKGQKEKLTKRGTTDYTD
ncbi:hypothetical protein [Candidatus Kuenenia sp.]|uniref:hypothetical protein n=1 Tax=Candidatus Kuenenia sp. TaxID=2499824 RepID=UPI0032205001